MTTQTHKGEESKPADAVGFVECQLAYPGLPKGNLLAKSVTVHFTNSQGGTADAPIGRYRVRIKTRFVDGEIGDRAIGELLEPADIEKFRRAGTTKYSAKWMRSNRPNDTDGIKRHEEAERIFLNPPLVYFAPKHFKPETA